MAAVVHVRLVFVVAVHTLFGFPNAWISTSVNLLQPFLLPFANQSFYNHYHFVLDDSRLAWLWSGLAVSANIGNLFGALSLGFLMDKYGRRDVCMRASNTLVFGAVLCHLAALHFDLIELVFLGRVVNGIASAYTGALVIYLTESVAASIRGCTVMLLTVGGGIFAMLGMVLVLPQVLGNEQLWKYFFVLPIIPAVVHFSASFVFPKSAKYLFINLKDEESATAAIEYFQGSHANIEEIREQYRREADLSPTRSQLPWRSLWSTRHFRVPFFICIVACLAAGFNGTVIANQYGRPIVEEIGINPNVSVAVMIGVGVAIFTGHLIISFFVIDRLGRRPLLLAAVAVAVVGLSLLFVSRLRSSDHHPDHSAVTLGLLGILFFTGSDVLGIGAVAAVLLGEVCPQASRARTASATATVGVLVGLVQVLAYPPLDQTIGAYCFLPVIAAECLCFCWLLRYLPETKQMPVDEIVATWIERTENDESNLIDAE